MNMRKVRAGLLGIVAATACLAGGIVQAAPFAAYVMDGRTGQKIHEQNANTPLHPASLTKMMTLYLAFAAVEQGRVRLDSRFTVSSNAANEPPSRLGLRAGQQIELRYLMRAAAIKSANDAATAIAEGIGGSEAQFAAQMTATARALGMTHSQFRNAHGLTQEGHYSTAKDMTTLGRHLFYDFPQYYNLFSRRSADAGIATVASTNRRFLDDYPGADGIKTGYTRAAGFNLTASAQRGQKRIMATVMGGASTAQRNKIMGELLDMGFGRAPARVAEVRPQTVIVKPQVVRRAAVQAAAPPAPRAVAAASTAAPALDLSQALREAMAARPEPAPRLVAVAGAEPVAEAVAQSVRAARPAPSPDPVAAAVGDALRNSLLESRRPAARPEGSIAEVGPATEAPAPAAAASAGDARPPRRGADAASLFKAPAGEATIVAAAMPVETRDYAVTLGLFRSQSEAEQLLLQTALRETEALKTARSRGDDTRRGFDARFVNLTRSEAELACGKLGARAQDCTVIVP
ncbi:D-alanyl-D-alanine carboxypeptidase [Paracoccus sp. S-4012]|uniref:D-alanyl-D-alanine carboxypeptidase family protein n=1 Tax=Paracoccus sp. S-4012 TaxID=2665648 RepID=UPI0012B05F68|nr:D-alanyl-D-alanine carboxypeptidase family protein [Paracoccus sp. S-4012]MRX50878.1 D-alanyl-D-alanine carboxypeptidase [Paracoccus sp. S-4012]